MKRKILKMNKKKWSKWLNLVVLGWCPPLVVFLVTDAFLYVPAKIQLNRS